MIVCKPRIFDGHGTTGDVKRTSQPGAATTTSGTATPLAPITAPRYPSYEMYAPDTHRTEAHGHNTVKPSTADCDRLPFCCIRLPVAKQRDIRLNSGKGL